MPREQRYSEFFHLIDVDAFEEAIDFEYIETDANGNDVGHCPDPWGMHKNGDTTGKFAIHREKKVFNCWVCGGGTLLSLAMALWDLAEPDAVARLWQLAAEPTDERFEEEIDDLLRDERRREPIAPWFNEHVLDRFEKGIETTPLWDWCIERGISEEVCDEHRVTFDHAAVKVSKRGRYEGPGIILPHFWSGRLVGWQTRWLEPDDVRPPWVQKYNNTLDFPKRWTIYNYEKVYLSHDPIVVVESVPTALMVESCGFPCVAVFGASVTPEQLSYLRACQQGLILAPDNDKPGMEFLSKAIPYLERYVDVRVCLPVGNEGSGSDLADIPSEEAIEVIGEAEVIL